MKATLAYPAALPWLVDAYEYDRLAAELGEALDMPVTISALAEGEALPPGPVIWHPPPVSAAIGGSAERTVMINADPGQRMDLLALRPAGLVTRAALAVWTVEPGQAASSGIWVRDDLAGRLADLAPARGGGLEGFQIATPAPGTTLAQLIAALLS